MKLTYYNALPRPFLARHPRVGYGLAALGLLGLLLLSWQVKVNPALHQADLALATAVVDWARTENWAVVLAMRYYSALGRDGLALMVTIFVIVWVRRNQRRELYMLVFGVLGAELWFQVMGSFMARERPVFKDPFEILIGYGYPSGHAATNLALAWLMVYLVWNRVRTKRLRILYLSAAASLVIMISFSRLFLGLHYPTDLIAGLLLGMVWCALVFTTIDVYFWRPRSEESLIRQYPGTKNLADEAVRQLPYQQRE